METASKEREKVWDTLSEFYLDNEIQGGYYDYIYDVFVKSGFTMKEIRAIDKYEVFPVVFINLLSVAGEWVGFEREWLFKRCSRNFRRKNNILHRLKCIVLYLLFGGMTKEQWQEIEQRRNTT